MSRAPLTDRNVRALGLSVRAPTAKLPIQSPRVAIMSLQTKVARKLAAELALPPAQCSRAGMAPLPGTTFPDHEWSI